MKLFNTIHHFIKKIFSSKQDEQQSIIDPMKKFLIVGLGNPGPEYKYTRHNIGFLIADKLAAELKAPFKTERYADVAKGNYRGKKIIIIKPNTFMNLSGKAVRYWLEKEKIDKDNMLVLTDDINLDFGTIRLRPKGSDGGHNGLKSIQELLGSNQYPRLRFGIGKDYPKGKQSEYVLGKWSEDQMEILPERVQEAEKAVMNFIQEGLNRTMNKFNIKKTTNPD